MKAVIWIDDQIFSMEDLDTNSYEELTSMLKYLEGDSDYFSFKAMAFDDEGQKLYPVATGKCGCGERYEFWDKDFTNGAIKIAYRCRCGADLEIDYPEYLRDW